MEIDKIQLRYIKKNNTILDALKKMDSVGSKLLIVIDNEKFFSLLSVGDIQRAIISNISLNTEIQYILRDRVNVAFINESANDIKTKMISRRSEFMPIIDENYNIIDVYFWNDLFENERIEPEKLFNIPVVIMAGGLGSRLRPLTNVLPKPLIPLGNKTITENIINNFEIYGCNKFLISLNYKADLIEYYLKSLQLDLTIYFYREVKPLGTAGSLNLMKENLEDTFFVSNCDIIIEQDYSEILDYHFLNKNDITIVAALKHFNIPYGIVNTIENGILSSIDEKPDLTFKINSGMYILQKKVLDLIPENQLFHITNLIESIIRNGGKVGVFPVSEKSWKDIGEWKEYISNVEFNK